MDYDQLIEQWELGNRVTVAAQVYKFTRSEIICFVPLFVRKFGEDQTHTLETMVQILEEKAK